MSTNCRNCHTYILAISFFVVEKSRYYLCCVEKHEVYQFVSCATTTYYSYIPLPNMGQICLVQQRSIKSVYNFQNKKGEGREKKHSTPQKKIRKNIIYTIQQYSTLNDFCKNNIFRSTIQKFKRNYLTFFCLSGSFSHTFKNLKKSDHCTRYVLKMRFLKILKHLLFD